MNHHCKIKGADIVRAFDFVRHCLSSARSGSARHVRWIEPELEILIVVFVLYFFHRFFFTLAAHADNWADVIANGRAVAECSVSALRIATSGLATSGLAN